MSALRRPGCITIADSVKLGARGPKHLPSCIFCLPDEKFIVLFNYHTDIKISFNKKWNVGINFNSQTEVFHNGSACKSMICRAGHSAGGGRKIMLGRWNLPECDCYSTDYANMEALFNGTQILEI